MAFEGQEMSPNVNLKIYIYDFHLLKKDFLRKKDPNSPDFKGKTNPNHQISMISSTR